MDEEVEDREMGCQVGIRKVGYTMGTRKSGAKEGAGSKVQMRGVELRC